MPFTRPGKSSGGGGSYGTFTNSSTGETRDFGNTKPPPGWTKAGAVDPNYVAPEGLFGMGVGAEGVDPFAIAMMAAEFNSKMQPEVLARSTEQGFALANRGTESNVSAFTSLINRIAPGYGRLLRQMEDEASAFMAGELPKDTADLLYRDAAERGVARGAFGQRAQYEGLTSIRDKRLQVMELGFNQASALRAESDRVAQSLIVNPVSTTLDLYSRALPLFTIAVGEALNVETANADRATQASIAEGQLGLGYANLQLNAAKFQWEKDQAEAQRKAAERNGLFSLVGTVAGAAGGLILSGGNPAGAMIGAQLGGALGSAAAGNYAGASTSLGQGLGTIYGQSATNSGIFAPSPPPSGTALQRPGASSDQWSGYYRTGNPLGLSPGQTPSSSTWSSYYGGPT